MWGRWPSAARAFQAEGVGEPSIEMSTQPVKLAYILREFLKARSPVTYLSHSPPSSSWLSI
jgi:hypothetical protein